jgi:hypothetical protein
LFARECAQNTYSPPSLSFSLLRDSAPPRADFASRDACGSKRLRLFVMSFVGRNTDARIARHHGGWTMKYRATALLVSAALSLSGTAIADDSSAALGMGGIQLKQSSDIRMAAEDLSISPTKVRVRFDFANDSGKDIDTVVAFVLPDIDTSEFSESAIGTVTNDPVNFVGFQVTADGWKIPFQVEQRAVYQGRDVTAIVKAAGLPINIIAAGAYDTLKKLTPANRKMLEAKGLADVESGEDEHPHWTVQTRFYWNQKFPAGKTVVFEQSYQPVTGEAFFMNEELAPAAKGEFSYSKNYCFDAPTRAEIEKQLAISAKANRQDGAMLYALTTDYILVTGNNWKGPIGHFHLTLDKQKPENVLSLCWDGDLKRTGATTFEATRENFAPAHDIHLLVLEQRPPN